MSIAFVFSPIPFMVSRKTIQSYAKFCIISYQDTARGVFGGVARIITLTDLKRFFGKTIKLMHFFFNFVADKSKLI